MHQTRQHTSTRIPITRKGTKYIVSSKGNSENSVPVVLAVRDMLKLARTAKEVHELVKDDLIKLNGRSIKDLREPVQLFGVLNVGDKHYRLSLLPTNKFFFEEVKEGNKRLTKIIRKSLVYGGKVQVGLSDGSAVIGKAEMKINDSIYLDNSQKVIQHVPLKSGSNIFVIAGRYSGNSGKVVSYENGKVKVQVKDKEATLPASNVIAQ